MGINISAKIEEVHRFFLKLRCDTNNSERNAGNEILFADTEQLIFILLLEAIRNHAETADVENKT